MLQPARVQANFLGYPGTLGADAIPYIVSDRATVPPLATSSVSERLVMLPWALMPTKRWMVPPVDPNIEQLQDKFVLGSFHKAAKVSPAIFGVWSNLVKRVPEGQIHPVAFWC